METSLLLARILGPFYIAVGLGILINRGVFERVAVGVEESPALFYLSGAFAYAAGALILAFHNQWSGWPVVITLLGWLAVLKGVMRLAVPTYSRTIVARALASPNTLLITGIVTLILGAYLAVMGFSATT